MRKRGPRQRVYAVAEVLRPFVKDDACGRRRDHRNSISVVFGTPVSLQLSVELEVQHCAEFLLGRGRSEPESAQLRRVGSMNRTIRPSRRVVYIAALQHVIFNAGSTVIERMIRDWSRISQVSLFSQF